MHSRLENGKSRLVSAIQACEAATACISRPTTPLEDVKSLKETEAKQTLEDLMDQEITHSDRVRQLLQQVETKNIIETFDSILTKVQGRMSELGAKSNEYTGIQKQKENLI